MMRKKRTLAWSKVHYLCPICREKIIHIVYNWCEHCDERLLSLKEIKIRKEEENEKKNQTAEKEVEQNLSAWESCKYTEPGPNDPRT